MKKPVINLHLSWSITIRQKILKNHKNGSQDQVKLRKIDLLTLHHPQTGVFEILTY